jgi:hypothetical protein
MFLGGEHGTAERSAEPVRLTPAQRRGKKRKSLSGRYFLSSTIPSCKILKWFFYDTNSQGNAMQT